jgi:hypothetical protein
VGKAMIPVNITLQYVRDGAKQSKRLTLSLDSTVGDIVTELIDELGLTSDGDGQKASYFLLRQRQVLDNVDKLYESGVQEGDILQLTIIDPNATMGQAISSGLLNRLGGKASVESLPVNAVLIAENGQEFQLSHTRALIGRADQSLGYPSESLDADLTNLDSKRTVSRPHALIVYANGEFTIRDLYSQRGVFVNDERVSPSKAAVLHDGDVLTLGDVRVQFRCES